MILSQNLCVAWLIYLKSSPTLLCDFIKQRHGVVIISLLVWLTSLQVKKWQYFKIMSILFISFTALQGMQD